MGIKHPFVSAKSDGGDSTLVQPSNWNATHTIDTQVDFPSATPSTPSANNVGIFGRKIAGRMMPGFIGPSGLDSALQPLIGRNKLAIAMPVGNSTTLSTLGVALSATGTATAANVATTNKYTSMRCLEYLQTTASATAVAGFRSTAAQFWTGNAAGLGGFTYICRWGPATGVSNTSMRAFVGLRNATGAPTDVEPSSQTDCIGMGWDAADTNAQFFYNDSSGTASKIDLGSSFPVPTTNRASVYEIAMFCAPNTATIYYEVTDLVSGAVATGSVTTDIPSNTTLLTPIGYMSVGGVSNAVGIGLFGLYIETDY